MSGGNYFSYSGLYGSALEVGVSKNRGSQSSTLNSRILIIRTPKIRYPHFRKLPGPFLLRSLGLKHAYRTSTKVGNPIASIPKSDV